MSEHLVISPISGEGVRLRWTSLPSIGYSPWSSLCQSYDLQALGEVFLEGWREVVVWRCGPLEWRVQGWHNLRRWVGDLFLCVVYRHGGVQLYWWPLSCTFGRSFRISSLSVVFFFLYILELRSWE